MAAPLCRTYLRLVWLKSQNVSSHVTHRRNFRIYCAVQQKRKSPKSKKGADIDLDGLFPQTSTKAKSTRAKGSKKSDPDITIDNESRASDIDFAAGRLSTPSFKQILHERHQEALRSVVIRSENPESTVQSLLSFGTLHHAQFTSQDKSYILAEYADVKNVKKLRSHASFFNEPNQFPMQSRVLYNTATRQHKRRPAVPEIEEGNWHEKASNYYPVMNTLDEELETLCARRSLDASDLRLRFFVCLVIEELLQGLLPGCRVLPYGSCLNGFGWWNSDLDMMLCLQRDPYTTVTAMTSDQAGLSAQFRLLTETFSTERQLAQRTLAMIASLLELTPRVRNVMKILNARVPIIRFKNMAANLQCDISIQAMDSIKMTELLYLFSICDPRVKPLMTGLKQWAVCHRLTASGEQQKPTTIGILTLLLFYLQNRSPPVVPTLKQIQALAKTTEMFYIDKVLYGLPSEPSLLPKSQNTESIESLLHGFFTFYSEFDFANKAISIIEGTTYPKPRDSSPVHMENPLCIGLNICRNISGVQLNSFTTAMKEAAQRIEALAAQNQLEKPKLASLCHDSASGQSRLSVLFSSNSDLEEHIPIEVSDLFADESVTVSNGDKDNVDVKTEDNDVVDVVR